MLFVVRRRCRAIDEYQRTFTAIRRQVKVNWLLTELRSL